MINEQTGSSDVAIMDLLRKRESATVAELGDLLGVTATAVRQRLTRLMAKGYVDRVTERAGRGRPSHRYVLTKDGLRQTGANFADLSVALWQEIRAIEDPEVRRGLIQRISRRMAELYADQITGDTVEERMQSLAELFRDRQIPFTVEHQAGLPVLTAMACPYPELADQDQSICSMERMLFSELLGHPVRLTRCRLDDQGSRFCSFEARQS